MRLLFPGFATLGVYSVYYYLILTTIVSQVVTEHVQFKPHNMSCRKNKEVFFFRRLNFTLTGIPILETLKAYVPFYYQSLERQ